MVVCEAINILSKYRIGLRHYGSLQWQLFYREDGTNQHSRLVDSLEEAVSLAPIMRHERDEEQSGDKLWNG